MAEQHINYDTFYPDASLEDAQRRLSGALDAATAAERLRGWLCTSGAQGMEAFIAVNNFPADAACTLWFSLREGRAKPVPASDAGQRLAVATAVMSRLGLHLNKALSQAGAEAAGVDRAPGSPSDQGAGHKADQGDDDVPGGQREPAAGPAVWRCAREAAKLTAFLAAHLLLGALGGTRDTAEEQHDSDEDGSGGIGRGAGRGTGLYGVGQGGPAGGRGRARTRAAPRRAAGGGEAAPPGAAGPLAALLGDAAWAGALQVAAACTEHVGRAVWHPDSLVGQQAGGGEGPGAGQLAGLGRGLTFGSAREARAVAHLLSGVLAAWVPRLPARPPAAVRAAVAAMRGHLAGLLCSVASHGGLSLQRRELPCRHACSDIPAHADGAELSPVGPPYLPGAPCCLSFEALLADLAQAAAASVPPGAGGKGGAAAAAAAGPAPSAAASSSSNVTAVLVEALLLAFDRDPGGGPLGAAVLQRVLRVAEREVAGEGRAQGAGGAAGAEAGTGTKHRAAGMKRSRSGSAAAGQGGRVRGPAAAAEGSAEGAAVRGCGVLAHVSLQGACGAAEELRAPAVAAAVLQVLLPHYGAVPAAGRKALVDLAAVAGAAGEGEGQQGQAAGAGGSADGVDGAPTSSAQGGCLAIGLAVLAEGCSDGDSHTRTRALAAVAACMPCLVALMAREAAPAGKAAGGHEEAHLPCGGQLTPGVARGLLASLVLPVLRTRLLDRVRAVRWRALQLLLELLGAGSAPQEQDARGKPGSAGLRATSASGSCAPLAAAQREAAEAAARCCLGEVCALLEAPHGSPLYADPPTAELLQQAVYGIATALPPAAFLRLLLPPPPKHSKQWAAAISRAAAAGVPLPPSLSPATRRRLAEGVALPPGEHGSAPCPRAVQSVYDTVLAALTPHAPWPGTPAGQPVDDAGWGGGAQGDGEGEGHEAALAAAGAALGGTALHGVLWRRAFQELCAVLAEREEEEVEDGEEAEGTALRDQQQHGDPSKGLAENPEGLLGLATRLRRLGGAFRVLLCLQRYAPPERPPSAGGQQHAEPGPGSRAQQPGKGVAVRGTAHSRAHQAPAAADLAAAALGPTGGGVGDGTAGGGACCEVAVVLDALSLCMRAAQHLTERPATEPAAAAGSARAGATPGAEVAQHAPHAEPPTPSAAAVRGSARGALCLGLRLLVAALPGPGGWGPQAGPQAGPEAGPPAGARGGDFAPRLALTGPSAAPDSGAACRLLLSYLDRASPALQRHGGLAAVDAAYEAMSRCPGSGPVMHRHLRALRSQLQRHGHRQQHHQGRPPVPERESQVPGPRCSPQPAASTRSTPPAQGHADPVCCYLLLLQHMVRLFEHQRTDLLRRLQRPPADSGRRHASGSGSGAAVAASGQDLPPAVQLGGGAAAGTAKGETGRSTRTVAQTGGCGGGDGGGGSGGGGGGGGGGGNYMTAEEEAQGAAAAAQRLTEELLAAAAPASHLPVVLGLMGPLRRQGAQRGGQGEGQDAHSCGPYHVRVRVLALRALGSLLALSGRLAERHGALVAGLLGAAMQQQPTGAETPCEAWDAGNGQQGGSASPSSATALPPAPLVCEAAGVASRMVLADPNRHRPLLGRLEGAVLAAVEPLLRQRADEGPGGGRPAGEAQRERSAAVLPGLVRSLCLLLASGRLQWSPSTLRAMAACLLAPEALREQVALPVLALLGRMGAAPRTVEACWAAVAPLTAASTGGGAGPGRRAAVVLGLLHNCPVRHRCRLVEAVLLGPGPGPAAADPVDSGGGVPGSVALLGPDDLRCDDFVLPAVQAVQALWVAGPGAGVGAGAGAGGGTAGDGGGRSEGSAEANVPTDVAEEGASAAAAALLLLRHMTPTPCALSALLPQMQGALRDPWAVDALAAPRGGKGSAGSRADKHAGAAAASEPGPDSALQVLSDFVARFRAPGGTAKGAAGAGNENAAHADGGAGGAAQAVVGPSGADLGPGAAEASGGRGGAAAVARRLQEALGQLQARAAAQAAGKQGRAVRPEGHVARGGASRALDPQPLRSYEQAVRAFAQPQQAAPVADATRRAPPSAGGRHTGAPAAAAGVAETHAGRQPAKGGQQAGSLPSTARATFNRRSAAGSSAGGKGGPAAAALAESGGAATPRPAAAAPPRRGLPMVLLPSGTAGSQGASTPPAAAGPGGRGAAGLVQRAAAGNEAGGEEGVQRGAAGSVRVASSGHIAKPQGLPAAPGGPQPHDKRPRRR